MTIRPFSLYVHIPFCAQKCPYCDFYDVPRVEDVVAHFEEERRRHEEREKHMTLQHGSEAEPDPDASEDAEPPAGSKNPNDERARLEAQRKERRKERRKASKR